MNVADMRKEDGTLPAYAWPGGYPIIYLDKHNSVLCPKCANKPADRIFGGAVAGDIYYEGPTIQCDECGAMIKSAYGDPEEEKETEEE